MYLILSQIPLRKHQKDSCRKERQIKDRSATGEHYGMPVLGSANLSISSVFR
jgi:hypothetical protein